MGSSEISAEFGHEIGCHFQRLGQPPSGRAAPLASDPWGGDAYSGVAQSPSRVGSLRVGLLTAPPCWTPSRRHNRFKHYPTHYPTEVLNRLRKIVHMYNFKRASRVPLGKRALGSCWAKGPAVVGIRGTLGRRALWASGALGGWANGAFGGCSAAIPNGKPFRVDVILIETRFGLSRSLPNMIQKYVQA